MQNDLFSVKESGARGKDGILSSLGILCAAATVLVFSALFFTDLSVSAMATLDLGLDFALLYFSSYVMYFSLFETGRERAKTAERYRTLHEKRALLFRRYRSEGSGDSLARFCEELSRQKTAERHAARLSALFLSEEEYKALTEKAPDTLTKKEKRLLRKVRRARAVRISPRMLLAEEEGAGESVPFSHSPAAMRRGRFARFLLPTALTALFSVSVACQVMENPSPDLIVGYLLKLFTLFFNGVKGFRSGYAHIAEEMTAYITEQCFWLEEYFSSLTHKE